MRHSARPVLAIILCGLLGALSFGVVDQSFDDSARPPVSRRPAIAGGDSSGGGNHFASEAAQLPRVTYAIEQASWFLPSILQAQELLGAMPKVNALAKDGTYRLEDYSFVPAGWSEDDFRRHLDGARKKLFASSPSVYETLRKVHFVAKVKGGCRDRASRDKDGAAFNQDPLEICLSADRLARRLDRREIVSTVFSLAVHELVHRQGGSEAEATAMQAAVFTRCSNDLPALWDQIHERENQISRAGSALNVGSLLDRASAPEFCANLADRDRDLDQVLKRTVDDIFDFGFLAVSPQGLEHLASMVLQIRSIRDYCYDPRDANKESGALDNIPTALRPFHPNATAVNAPVDLETIRVTESLFNDRLLRNDTLIENFRLRGSAYFVPYLDKAQALRNANEAARNFDQIFAPRK